MVVSCGEVEETEELGFQGAKSSQILLNVRHWPAFKPPCRSIELDEVQGHAPFARSGLLDHMELTPV